MKVLSCNITNHQGRLDIWWKEKQIKLKDLIRNAMPGTRPTHHDLVMMISAIILPQLSERQKVSRKTKKGTDWSVLFFFKSKDWGEMEREDVDVVLLLLEEYRQSRPLAHLRRKFGWKVDGNGGAMGAEEVSFLIIFLFFFLSSFRKCLLLLFWLAFDKGWGFVFEVCVLLSIVLPL